MQPFDLRDSETPVLSGVSLRRQVRDATVEVLDGLVQLLEVLLSSPLQRLVHTETNGRRETTSFISLLFKSSKLLISAFFSK